MNKKRELSKTEKVLTGIGASSVTSVAATLPLILGTKDIHQVMSGEEVKGVPGVSSKTIEDFQKHYKIDIPVHEKGYPASFVPKFLEKHTNMPAGAHINKKVLPVTLHELGHAVNYNKLPKLKYFARSIGMLGGPVAGLGLLTSDKTVDYATPVTALGMAPMLIDEAMASGRALKYIKRTNPDAFKNSAKLLAKALGTYGMKATGAIGGIALAAKYIKHRGETKNG